MFEFILRIVILITILVIVQVFFNIYIYRQPRSYKKLIIYGLISSIVISIGIFLWISINKIQKTPLLGTIIYAIDYPFRSFINYLYKPLLVGWFIIPMIIIWLIFIFKGGMIYYKIKQEYFKFINEHKDSIKPSVQAESKTPSLITKNKKECEATQLKPLPKLYFLENIKIHAFNHRSLSGLAKVLPIAQHELVIGKTSQGYVAIYENKKGYQKLKQIFSRYGIDIAELQAKPSIVFFTTQTVRTIGLKDYVNKLKEV